MEESYPKDYTKVTIMVSPDMQDITCIGDTSDNNDSEDEGEACIFNVLLSKIRKVSTLESELERWKAAGREMWKELHSFERNGGDGWIEARNMCARYRALIEGGENGTVR